MNKIVIAVWLILALVLSVGGQILIAPGIFATPDASKGLAAYTACLMTGDSVSCESVRAGAIQKDASQRFQNAIQAVYDGQPIEQALATNGLIFSALHTSVTPPHVFDKFSYFPIDPVAGNPVTFDGSASICVAPPCRYRWTDDTNGSLLGTGVKIVYTFRQAGRKFIRLTVTDARSKIARGEYDVVVSLPPPPVPVFTWTPEDPMTGSAVAFDASLSTCPDGPCSYNWTADDDGTQFGTSITMSFAFHDSGTKPIRLAITDAAGQAVSVEHDVVISGPPPPPPPPSPPPATGKLTWSPPPCGDATHACVDLNFADTGSIQKPSLNANTDYRLHLPTTGPVHGGLWITSGRNVQIIGGEIILPVPCSDASNNCPGIYISKPTAGLVHIEGVWIHNVQSPITQSTGDGIIVDDVVSAANDITIENVRVEGISGCSGGPDHADVYQPYAAAKGLQRIDHLTGTTNCQGLQLEAALAISRDASLPGLITLKNVNMNVFPNPYRGTGDRQVYWLTDNLGCTSGPIILQNVWASEPSGGLSINGVWPDTDQPSACKSLWDGTAKQLSFPASPQITGVINAGLPAGGDFVPVGMAGIGYVSPGYQ